MVILGFPGHIATALQIDGMNEGRQVTFQGQEYWVCDPSFNETKAGEMMPEYQDKDFEVIALRSWRMEI